MHSRVVFADGSLSRTATAAVCIFSTFLLGCYGSTMIDMTGESREELRERQIDTVTTKEGITYVFRMKDSSPAWYRPATLMDDSIIGHVDGKRVAISLSDVAVVHVQEFRPVQTVLFSLAGAGVAVFLILEMKKNIRFSE